MSPPRVSIVLVNWNNLEDSVECIDSLVRCTYPDHDVTVVDNGSDGDDARHLRERFGEAIRLIESATNAGFAGGSNLGIKDSLDRGADYVLLLNNDTVVAPEFLDELMAVVRNDPGIGIAGGKILCHEFPQLIWSAGGSIDYRRGSTPVRGSGEEDDGRFDQQVEVDWICACFMLVSRDVWEGVGLLDDRFFFGWEDVDLCVRAAKGGHRVVYAPRAVVWHKGFGETKKTRLQGRPLYYATRGQFLFLRKHYSRAQLLRVGLSMVTSFPKAMWDYSRITGQWKGPLYMMSALLDSARMARARNTRP